MSECSKVRELRKKAGWSLAELCRRVGEDLGRKPLDQGHLSRLERRESGVSVSVADALQRVFRGAGLELDANRLLRDAEPGGCTRHSSNGVASDANV